MFYYQEILQSTLSLPRTGIEHVGISEFRHAQSYLSRVRIKCGTLWRLVLQSSRLLVAYFSRHASTWMPLILDYLFLYRFLSRIWLPCKEGNEAHHLGNLHILLVSIPSPIYLPLPRPIHFPVYGIISRCPIDRKKVASDSALGTSWFWSASRACPIDSSTVLWACLKITIDLRGIKPTPGFSPGFRLKFASPGGNTGVPHY